MIFSLAFFLLISKSSLSQTDNEKVNELIQEAFELVDDGKYAEGIKLLKQADELDPNNPGIQYEIAFANYLNKNYKEAINVALNIKDKEILKDIYYQVLGNSYDLNGEKDKAIKTYEDGLKLYPNAGRLYLELGVVNINHQDMKKSMSYFEKGIQMAPEFPSNYYWASKVYCNSKQNEVWGLIYGEIFMNLERGSSRTAEISKLLYDTYKQGITIISDTSAEISFANDNIDISNFSNSGKIKLPFGTAIFEPTMLLALVPLSPININSLSRIRESFIKLYYENGYNREYPINIFDYQNKVLQGGHMDAYNHWLLMKGSQDEFDNWIKEKENESKFDDFIEWFKTNQFVITDQNKTYREQY